MTTWNGTVRGAACWAAAGVLAAACQSAAGEVRSFAELAPGEAAVVFGTGDAAGAKAAFERTPMAGLLDEPSIKEWWAEQSEEMFEDLDEFLERIDAEREDFSLPTGVAGGAMWLVPMDEVEEAGTPLHFLMGGDFGERAATMHEKIMAALEEGEAEDELLFTFEDVSGGVIVKIEEVESEDDAGGDEDGMEDDWGEDWEEWDDGGPELDTMWYGRREGFLMISTSERDLENALGRLDGGELESAAESSALRSIMSHLGDGGHLYGVVLNPPLYRMTERIDEASAEDEFGGPAIMPILDAAGLSEVRSFGGIVRFDAESGMMEQEYAVVMPRKRGLLSLIDVEPARLSPPAWVSADATSVSLVQLNFRNLLPMVQQVMNQMPAEVAQQGMMMMGMAQGLLGPALANFGSEVWIVQRHEEPFSATSEKYLVGIRVTDEAAVGNAVQQLTQSPFLPLVESDFQGRRIWAPDAQAAGMMGPVSIAIGLGDGYLFMGERPSVEGALREADAGAASLAREERFRAAMRALPADGLSFSYTDMAKTLRYYAWFIENYEQVMEAQMEQMLAGIDDPELRDMIRESQGETAEPEMFDMLPDVGTLSEYLGGDTVGDVVLTDWGLKGRFVWLRPAED